MSTDEVDAIARSMSDDALVEQSAGDLGVEAHEWDLGRGELYPELLRATATLRARAAAAFELDVAQVHHSFGANGALDMILGAARLRELEGATEGRAGVLVATPTYFRNHQVAVAKHLALHTVPLDAEMRFDRDRFVAEMSRVRPDVVVLVTPNNPTGIAIADGDLEAVFEALPEGTWCIVDRTLVNVAPEIPTRALLARHGRRNVVVLHSFSKYKAMSQHRVGLALYANADFARCVEPNLPLALSLESCVKAIRWLEADGGLAPTAEVVARIRQAKVMLGALTASKRGFETTDFTGNFCLLTLPGHLHSGEVSSRLAQEGIHVLGGHTLPEPNPRVLRVHTGGPASHTQRLIHALRGL